MICQHTMTLGVYLLGALEPAERSEFESHLSHCDTCRRELVRLSPLPGLLNQITAEDFADGLPPTDPAVTMSRPQPVPGPVSVSDPEPAPVAPLPAPTPPQAQPPSRYWRVAAAAAAVVVLAIGAVFGWRAIREEPAVAGVTWSVSAGEASAEARLVEHEWGTEIQSRIKGLPPDRECYLVVYDHYGNREVAGWWGTDHDPDTEIPGSTSIQRGKIDRLVYMLDDKETVALTIDAPDG